MARCLRLLAVTGTAAAAVLFAAGCEVAFLAPLPGTVVDAGPYIGMWTIEGPGSETEVISVRRAADGWLRVDFPGGPNIEPEVSFTATLTQVDGVVVAWLAYGPGLPGADLLDDDWSLLRERALWVPCALDESMPEGAIMVRPLDQRAVAAAIEAGSLPATAVEFRSEDGEVGVSMLVLDDPATLRRVGELGRLFQPSESEEVSYLHRLDPLEYAAVVATADAVWHQEADRAPTADTRSGAYPPPAAQSRHGYPDVMPSPQAYMQPAASSAEPEHRRPIDRVRAALAALPLSIDRLLVALAVTLLAGAAAAFAVDRLRRRDADQRTLLPGDEPSSQEQTAARGGLAAYLWPAVLLLAVVGAPTLYLAILLRGLSMPGWAQAAPAGTAALLHDFAPYALVLSFGAVIGVAEVIGAYPAFALAALRTRWAAIVVLFNCGGTVLAYSVATAYASGSDHPLLRTLAAAIGFAIVIRTRFVIARDLDDPGGGRGIQIDFGWPYARLQALARHGISRELLHDRGFAIHAVLLRCPDTASLERFAAEALRVAEPSDAARLDAELREIREGRPLDAITRARIAALVVEVTQLGDLEFLLAHTDEPSPAG